VCNECFFILVLALFHQRIKKTVLDGESRKQKNANGSNLRAVDEVRTELASSREFILRSWSIA
jgi:hypothetical protein